MSNYQDYESVEDRLPKFIKDFPDFRIATELISFLNGQYIVQAYLYRTFADSVAFATGLAEEKVAERGVNSTSALENCETSAIGRALANAGYAPKGKRPSREEMLKVAKAEMSKTKEYIPVPKEDDPWTIKTVAMPITAEDAVNTVKDIIGATTDKDTPRCRHGEMYWKHGTTKAGKPWGHFKCSAAANGEIDRCDKGEDVIWYEISPEGNWRPQKVKA